VEPGEIVACLETEPSVAAAFVHSVVVAGLTELVGYVVPRSKDLKPKTLRTFLAQHLPHHMIPRWFVFLDALPIGRNGKIEERDLPAFTEETRALSEEPAAHSTERVLVAIWHQVLGTSSFGLHDSFFDVGGHSLLMAKVGALLERQIGMSISIADLYRFPTVSSLAEHIRRVSAAKPD
jgi:hypothetical protein